MSYYYGIETQGTPTGFAAVTGFSVYNSGNSAVSYTLSISDTELIGLDPATDAIDQKIYNTLYFLKDDFLIPSNTQNLNFGLNPNESQIVQVYHRPFTNFVGGQEFPGDEYAQITVISESNFGDLDENIIIDVTGTRSITFSTPEPPISFIAFQRRNKEYNNYLDFSWQLKKGTYVTGFKIDLSSQTDFSAGYEIGDSPFFFLANANDEADSIFPRYGEVNGFQDQRFTFKITNMPNNENIYARISCIAPEEQYSNFNYATGFLNYFEASSFLLGKISTPIDEPGSNLVFIPKILEIDYPLDSANDINLMNILFEANSESYDFSLYSGARINFYPENNEFAEIRTSKLDGAPFVLVKPSEYSFNTGLGGNFNLFLSFENMKVFGRGASESLDSTQGGPVFNFDNLDYYDSSDPDNKRSFNYIIEKDKDSIVYSGLPSASPLIVTNYIDNEQGETQSSSQVIGSSLEHQYYTNLTLVQNISATEVPPLAENQNVDIDPSADTALLDSVNGSLMNTYVNTVLYPNIYLKNKFAKFPLYSRDFYFSANDSIPAGDAAGTKYSEWQSLEYNELGYSLVSSDGTPLKKVSAYGSNFYELDLNGRIVFDITRTIPLAPSHAILVFASDKNISDVLASSDKETVSSLGLHSFGNTSGDDITISNFYHYWRRVESGHRTSSQNSRYRITYYSHLSADFHSSFMNCINYKPQPWRNRGNGIYIPDGAVEYGGANYNNSEYSQQDGGRGDESVLREDRVRMLISPMTIKSGILNNDVSFINDNQKFLISESGGPDLELSEFYLHFVLMKSVGSGDSFDSTASSSSGARDVRTNRTVTVPIYRVISESFINSAFAASKDFLFSGGYIPLNELDFKISLHNIQSNLTSSPRIYFLDYYQGFASNVENNDFISNLLLEYFYHKHFNLFARSSNRTIQLLSGTNDLSETSSQAKFRAPHPFMNLYFGGQDSSRALTQQQLDIINELTAT